MTNVWKTEISCPIEYSIGRPNFIMSQLQSVWKRWARRGGKRSDQRSHASRGMAQGLAVSLLTLLLLSGSGIVRSWGNRTLDVWFAMRGVLPHDEDASPRVAVLAIDAPTRRAWNGRNFDARDVGRALIFLKQHGVVAVAVAVPEPERDIADAREKAQWQRDVRASAIAHLPNLAPRQASSDAANQTSLRGKTKPNFTRQKAPKTGKPADENSGVPASANPGNDDLDAPWVKDANRRGHTAFIVDNDAHVRRLPLVLQGKNGLVPALALSTALQALQLSPTKIVPQNERGQTTAWKDARQLSLNGRTISVESGGAMLLNFWAPSPENDDTAANDVAANSVSANAASRNRASNDELLRVPGDQSVASSTRNLAPAFETLSLEKVLRQPWLLNAWSGRSVVIGVTDAQAAPQWTLAGGARVPESILHAIVLDNLLSGITLDTVPTSRLWLLTILLGMTVGGLVAARPPLWSGLVTGLALLTVALLSLGLFIQNVWLDVSLPCTAAALTFLQGVVSRARLQERETTRVSSTVEALERAGAIIAARGQSQELLERVLQWTLAAMGADAAIALIVDDESDAPNDDAEKVSLGEARFRVLASVQRKPRALEVLPVEARNEIASRVTLQSQPMLIQDAHRDPRFRYGRSYYTHFRPLSAPGALSITSVIAAPLREGDPFADDPQSGVRTVGALLVLNRRDGTPFHPRDLELLTAVTNQASVALDNARLYDLLNQRVARSESDLERTNRRLEAEKNTLQTVLESMTDGVVVTDNQSCVQILNPSARALLPELNDDVLGQNLAQCLPDLAPNFALEGAPDSSSQNPTDPSAPISSTRLHGEAADSRNENTRNRGLHHENHESSGAKLNVETCDAENANTEKLNVESDSENTIVEKLADKKSGEDIGAENIGAQNSAADSGSRQTALRSETTQIVRGDIDAPRVIEVRSTPLLSAEPKGSGVVWVFSDVTEERNIEQAKSDFVAFVAHEMRSPLTSISGFSLMLQRMEMQRMELQRTEKPEDESSTRNETAPNASANALARDKKEKNDATRQRFLGVIHNESERLTRLINNLLDVARLEAGRDLALHRETLDFALVAGEAIESQRVYSSRHALVNAVSHDLPALEADRDKVLQILINLLSNAMKYSPGGVVTVSARAENGELVVGVRDEGPGIAPEHRARLFERFGRIGSRVSPAKTPGAGERAKPTGTGLGLFLTRHLVESHGGRIWLDEGADRGANFCFSLPLNASAERAKLKDF